MFGLAIAMVALYYTLRNVSLNDLSASFKLINYVYIFPAVMIFISSYIFRAYRWQALLRSSLKVDVGGLYSPMMVGFMGNFLPARAAEILRPYLLSKKYDITFSSALASIVMERLFDMVMLLFIFIWVFWFEADEFTYGIKFSGFSIQDMAIKFGQICLLSMATLIMFIYLLLNHKKKLMRLVNWFIGFLNEKWGNKIKSLIEEFAIGCEVIKNFRDFMKISIYSIFVWLANIFSIYPLYFAFDLQHKTISSLLIVAVIVSILITIVPTPGFLGSYNAGIFIALHEIMGESEIISVSIGIMGWALFSGVVLVSGLYFIFYDHMSIKTLVSSEREGKTLIDLKEK